MTVPENYEAGIDDKINAVRDLNPFKWEIREITDVDLVTFNTDDGGTNERIIAYIDPPIGEHGTTFVCNLTRERALAKATGTTKVNEWVGHRIAIRQGKTNYMGKEHKVVEIADVEPPTEAANDSAPVAANDIANSNPTLKTVHALQDDEAIPF